VRLGQSRQVLRGNLTTITLITPFVLSRSPLLGTLFTSRTSHPFCIPIHFELTNIVATRNLSLPADIWTNGSDQLKVVLFTTGNDEITINIASIDNVLTLVAGLWLLMPCEWMRFELHPKSELG